MHGSGEQESIIQDIQCTYKRNIDAPSGNHCCSGKAKNMGLSCKYNFVRVQFNLIPSTA